MTSGFEVWDSIFSDLPVLNEVAKNGHFFITSRMLNDISKPLRGPDARNLVKYDHKSALPPVMKKHNLSLLPIARGEFLIGRHKIYAPLRDEMIPPVRKLTFANKLESLQRISSETDALMVAYHGEAISKVLGEPVQLTGGGKEGGPGFQMRVDTIDGRQSNIWVKKGVSIEIDATYEGSTLVAAFEAKMKSVVDFNVRQLYFPFRSMSDRYRKPVRTVFLTYSNEIFDIREFVFSAYDNISSFKEISRFRFTTGDESISAVEIDNVAEVAKAKTPYGREFPFPQADSLERIINLVENLVERPWTKNELAEEFGFDERQSDYYGNAAGFLGLAQRIDKGTWEATKQAEALFKLPFKERNLAIAKIVLENDVFRQSYLLAREEGSIPSNDSLLTLLRESEAGKRISGSTLPRRTGTIKGWLRWLLSITENKSK